MSGAHHRSLNASWVVCNTGTGILVGFRGESPHRTDVQNELLVASEQAHESMVKNSDVPALMLLSDKPALAPAETNANMQVPPTLDRIICDEPSFVLLEERGTNALRDRGIGIEPVSHVNLPKIEMDRHSECRDESEVNAVIVGDGGRVHGVTLQHEENETG